MIFVDTDNFPFQYIDKTAFAFNDCTDVYYKGDLVPRRTDSQWSAIRVYISYTQQFAYSNYVDGIDVCYNCRT